MSTDKKSVMLALSGGVDSSVCISILKEMGYEIKAVVMKMSPAHDGTVCAAQKVADDFGIPLTILDLQDEFKKCVIDPFISAYQNAKTPNPCIVCNPLVKFKFLKKAADDEGCDFFATGHYAKVNFENGRYFISVADEMARDQSYMLYRLPQDILSRLILPLGTRFKKDVREKAQSLSLSSANAPDSQENCFIPDNDYASYILEHGGISKEGYFISPEGEKLTRHKGIIHYTVGQRKGLGIALGQPVFVNKIDAESGDVYLTYSGGQTRSEILVENCVFMKEENLTAPIEAEVKIRSAAKMQKAVITPTDAQGVVSVKFEIPASAPAPMQSAVFYIDGAVLGGGFIV